MTLYWYVAQTRPRQEFIAELNLNRQGFECYLPRITVKKRKRGHWASTKEPLFPGYILVRLDLSQGHIAPLFSTKGIRTLVRFSTSYLPFNDMAVAWLQLQERQQLAVATHELFSPGEELFILEGPFAGLKAVYQCSKGRDRVEILIQLLGSTHRLDIAQDQVCIFKRAAGLYT